MEQFLMVQKAWLFKDFATAEKILDQQSPAEHKRLGRTVKNFDDDVWDENFMTILHKGTSAKFNQNPALRRLLLSTSPRRIGEASEHDLRYGIGFNIVSLPASIPSLWRGENALGEVLQQVRQELACSIKGRVGPRARHVP